MSTNKMIAFCIGIRISPSLTQNSSLVDKSTSPDHPPRRLIMMFCCFTQCPGHWKFLSQRTIFPCLLFIFLRLIVHPLAAFFFHNDLLLLGMDPNGPKRCSQIKLIDNESKYCRITPLLYNLHWLPVTFRL